MATAGDPHEPLKGLKVGQCREPTVRPGWEVVTIRAAALNHHDLWTLRGNVVVEDPYPIVLGCDGSGITQDGREVLIHSIISPTTGRDETLDGEMSVLSEIYDGTHAEQVAVPSHNLIDKPKELSFEAAACLPTAWLTAYTMLFVNAQVRPGDRVLVQGAGGGVATAAIALGRAAGLRVYVSSRSERKRAQAEEIGAHRTLEPGERVPERVDAVIETVGKATYAHSLRAVRAGGCIVVAGATSGQNPPAELSRLARRQVRVIGSLMGNRRDLEALVRFVVDSRIAPPIDTTYELAEAREAYTRLADGVGFGKIMLVSK